MGSNRHTFSATTADSPMPLALTLTSMPTSTARCRRAGPAVDTSRCLQQSADQLSWAALKQQKNLSWKHVLRQGGN